MIKQLYIMKENGILLYSKNNTQEQLDDDILVGFFASIANFSRETLNTAVRNVNLGEKSKLILCPISEEKILLAAIVSNDDNEQLLLGILKDIGQDFIDEFGPNYIRENINPARINKIIDDNTADKLIMSKSKRFILSWLVLGPLSTILMFVSVYIGEFLAQSLGLTQPTFIFQDIISWVMPTFFLIATVLNLILFVFPNIINGFILLDRKLMYFNMIVYIILTLLEFYLADVFFMVVILLAYIPLVFIISTYFTSVGYNLAQKKKILEK